MRTASRPRTARPSPSRSSAPTASAASRTRFRPPPARHAPSPGARCTFLDGMRSSEDAAPMTNSYVVGIDAGATKTRAFAVDRRGEVVGRGAGGGANLLSSSDPQGSIGAALAEALAGRAADAIVLSAAGAERKADRERGHEILARLYGRPHPAPAIGAATRALALAAAEGDALANDIVRRGAVALARAATVVARSLGLAGGPVYLAGGAFESVQLLGRALRLELL